MCFSIHSSLESSLKSFEEIVAFVNLWNHFNLLFIQQEFWEELKTASEERESLWRLLIEVWQIPHLWVKIFCMNF